MNSTSYTCDQGRIDTFLASNCVGLEDAALLEHLNTCSSCREYMETQAAEPDAWTDIGQLLQTEEFDLASSCEFSLGLKGSDHANRPAAIQSVLDYLAPTEDPNRLGRLGTYEISGIVGAGAMGVVLKAVDPTLDRVVAIKVLAPYLAHSGTARQRFSREAKAAAAVLHPNVIPIHGVSHDQEIPYLVMAYIRGGSLQKRLDRDGPLPTLEILRIGSQVAAGLAAAHDQGLVHRDVKPENIMLEEGIERITLTDFGLARAVDDASVTQPGTIAGTPQYMSPEQTRGEAIDQQSDLFSLGCVLYALCTGRPPFRDETSYAVMRKISDESPMPIRELNPDIPDWLCAIISKLMAKKKTDRFKSAHDIQDLLEACLSHVQQPTHTELPTSLRKVLVTTRRQTRRNQLLNSKIGWLTMILLIGMTLLTFIVPSLISPAPQNNPSNTIDGQDSLTTNLQLLQGMWVVESSTENGNRRSEEEAGNLLPILQIEGRTLYKIENEPSGRWHEYEIEVDPEKNPKTIDLVISRKLDRRVKGIFEIKDDKLTICFSGLDRFDAKFGIPDSTQTSRTTRPVTFAAPVGSNHVLFVCRPASTEIDKLLLGHKKGHLSEEEIDHLIDLILERQGDRRLPWSTEMGDIIEKRWVSGKLDRDRWEQYTGQFLVDYFELKVRSRVVIGTPGGLKLQLAVQDVRCGSGEHMTFEIEERRGAVRVGETLVMAHDIVGNLGTLQHKGGHSALGRSCNFGDATWNSITPGKHRVTYESQLSVLESTKPEQNKKGEVFANKSVTLKTETTFLPKGQTTVTVNTDPLLKPDVDRSIKIIQIKMSPAVNSKTENKYFTNVRLDLRSCPIHLAFDIILKDGEIEYPCGSMTSTAGTKSSWEGVAYLPTDLSGRHVDVIFRPAPDVAENSLNLFEIWGEEIRMNNIMIANDGPRD